MIFPPSLMRLKVIDDQHHVNLWLPLFLIWIMLAILALVLTPLLLIAALVLWPFGWGKSLLLAGPRAYSCFCALRGLKIDVRKNREMLLMYFK